ncbi:hypothetical protein [Streptomyces sp. NPDC001194]|uniref:hypothetical protein n=1 Tax=Streptomyces sp. NPDC001194 TaxID=3364547 RepID=UPI0036C0EBD0
MGPYEWALIFAIAGILAVGGWQLTRPASKEDDDQEAWEKSTTAKRTEEDVRRDLADAKARLEVAELYAIWPDPPQSARQIPHQTRRSPRTEEDQ